MIDPSKPSKTRATPRQLALVAVLSVVFVIVLVVQFSGGSAAEQATEPHQARKPQVQTPPAATASRGTEATQQGRKLQEAGRPWPTLESKEVLSYDPFAAPAGLSPDNAAADSALEENLEAEAAARQAEAAERRAEQERTLTKLQGQGVTAIVGTTKRGRVAVVGSQVVRVGDVLEGFRVIAIEPEGVVLQLPVAKPSPEPE
jgi:hypothetical protein